MAVKEISLVKLSQNSLTDAVSFAAAAAINDGFAVDFTEQDVKIALIVQGGAAAGTITVKKGDSIQGVSDSEAFSVKASSTHVIALESGKYKNVTGANKGKVIIVPSATDIKIAAVVLP